VCAVVQILHIDMPEVKCLVDVWIELYDLIWIGIIMILKKQQIDSSGMTGKDREVDSVLVGRCA
jgi:hypothetical protein